MTKPASIQNAKIEIDGAQGEGGGQVLRSSLALSMATGRPFRMHKIRAGREKPGLMRQHLTCVQAAASICNAKVSGDAVGSQEITFEPGDVRPGQYHFPIGTAGSTTMVLQAILPALLIAKAPSTITVEGGTHNGMAPPFEFFERALLPLLLRAGAVVRARLERHGFYPAGGGRIFVEVDPPRDIQRIEILERGNRVSASARALLSRVPGSVGERELAVLQRRLGIEPHECSIRGVENSVGPGNALLLHLEYEHITEVFSSIGERAKTSEAVAEELATEARDYIAHKQPIGHHLADQLMVPLALLAGGRYATGPLTDHSRTNINVIAAFGGNVEFDAANAVTVHPLRSAPAC